jgi:signal transduction histidine kinase
MINALKYTQKGRIEMGYKLTATQLYCYVKDTGKGIEPDLHEKIFERFRQANTNVESDETGIGLGLAISKGFITKLGGQIGLDSIPGAGSTFYFTIPLTTSG